MRLSFSIRLVSGSNKETENVFDAIKSTCKSVGYDGVLSRVSTRNHPTLSVTIKEEDLTNFQNIMDSHSNVILFMETQTLSDKYKVYGK